MSDYRKGNNGYMVHRVDPNRYEHRDVWEKANGPIPIDHHIHHKNRIRTDNRLENLECLSRTVHMRLHGLTPEMVKHINSVRRTKLKRTFTCALASCGKVGETHHRTQKFCCAEHARKFQNNALGERRAIARKKARGSGKCPDCGKVFERIVPKQIYCSTVCSHRVFGRNYHRKRHPEWKRTWRVAA